MKERRTAYAGVGDRCCAGDGYVRISPMGRHAAKEGAEASHRPLAAAAQGRWKFQRSGLARGPHGKRKPSPARRDRVDQDGDSSSTAGD